jgi:hypothetical protein
LRIPSTRKKKVLLGFNVVLDLERFYKRRLLLELYIDLVFWVGVRLVFLGFYRTDTGGKLGRYIWVLFFWREPIFPQKGCHGPLFEGPSPHFEEKRVSRQTLKSSCQIL